MSEKKTKIALVMAGGGARAAYQIGVLKAIADMLPRKITNPFPIICGTSAGAINAASLATHAYSFRKSVQRLLIIWANFHAEHVFRTDVPGIMRTGLHWLLAMMSVGVGARRGSLYLLDREPLRKLLERYMHTEDIQHSIDKGYLHALSVSVSGYSSHESVSFFHGHPELEGWKRFRRIGAKSEIGVEHLMASSAIPFIFAPERIHREYFGDGSMRQIAPISPALHLGAEKVMVIGNRMEHVDELARISEHQEPTIGQIAGHALDSIFLDSLEADIERLERINRTVGMIPEKQRIKHDIGLRHVGVLVISPSQDIGKLAEEYTHELPRSIRFLLRGIGGTKRSNSNLVSYLLFEKAYCRRLIDLGFHDAQAKKTEILEFLGENANPGN